jgi:hypothetical protein
MCMMQRFRGTRVRVAHQQQVNRIVFEGYGSHRSITDWATTSGRAARTEPIVEA